jgi:hypothetical protein
LALLAIAVVPASADVPLYSNGPINGTYGGWDIFGGQAISDSFFLSSASTVTGVDFGAWTSTGDSVTSVQWSIGTTPGDGSLGGGVANTTDTFLFNNSGVYDIASDTFSTGNISLGAGTYYLTLQNSTTASGTGESFWDINNGPSLGFYSQGGGYSSLSPYSNGGTGSSAFDIQGPGGTVTPEPGSYAALILGFGGVMLLVRSRRAKQRG